MTQRPPATGIDDADHLDVELGQVEEMFDVGLTVGGARVAGDDDRLDRRLVGLRRFSGGRPVVLPAQQEPGVLDDVLFEQVSFVLLRAHAVRHVGRVTQVDEPFRLEIGRAVTAGRPSLALFVELIEVDDRVQHGQAAGSRIKHAHR